MKASVTIICQYNPLAASSAGGIGTLIRSYIAHAPNDFDFKVVGVSDDQDVFPLLKWHCLEIDGRNVPFLPIMFDDGQPKLLPLSIRFTYALYRYRHALDCNGRILHFHRPEPALPFLWRKEHKFVFIHNTVGELEASSPMAKLKGRLISTINRLAEDLVLPKVDRVWAVRESVAASYRLRYPRAAGRIAFMPTWVDTNHFQPPAPEQRHIERTKLAYERNWCDRDPYLLFLGRLEPQKDPLLLLSALQQLHQLGCSARLLVVGGGSLLNAMAEKVNALNLSDSVALLGDVPRTRVVELLSSADVMVLTSRYEGMPVAMLEALACGIPVVSTAVGDVHQALGRGGGRLVSSRDATVIAQNIFETLKQPPTQEECLQAVLPFNPTQVLSSVFQSHYSLLAYSLQYQL
jgi:glycosyltransferase involved in cell wall biosynthesis